MRIKRFEIQGFKSFKDKTEIYFDHNITGIVGPNGCGKSNIVDAFFWVMGEQSYKHMRGSGSQDLIFNGSSKYAPLGIAEATLILETTEVDHENAPLSATSQDAPLPSKKKEISVTRRVHRTGEGEYFINGIPARLKDIHELFMDTGVGAKGYSVIEQGQIDKVVNAKPEDRRKLIEEAAGIAKYKARKKESLRKIETAQSNLSRLNDVIQEIDRNLGSLERQAQKAQKYLEYRGELVDKEVTWGKRKRNIVEKKLIDLRATKESLEHEVAGMKAENATCDTVTETSRIEQLSLSKKLESLQEVVSELSQQLTREQSALQFSQKRQGELQGQIINQNSEKELLEKNIENERSQILLRKEELSKLILDLNQARESLNVLQSELGGYQEKTENKKSELGVMRKELYELMQSTSSLNSKMAVLTSRIETAHIQLKKTLEEEQRFGSEFEGVEKKLHDLTLSINELKEKKQNLQFQYEKHKETLQGINLEHQQKKKTQADLVEKITQKSATLDTLEELDKAYEGLTEGPKKVLDKSRNNQNTKVKLIADLLEVKEGYERAVEAVFSHKIEDFFTTDFNEAMEMITTLERGELGRAAFHFCSTSQLNGSIDLENFKLLETQELLSKYNLVCSGALLDFLDVRAIGEIKQTLESECARFFVIESLSNLNSDQFQDLSNDLNGRALITLDGVVFDSLGTLRGGKSSGDSTAHLLARKSEIKKIRKNLEELETSEVELNASLSELELKKVELESTIEQLRGELQGVEVNCAGSERECLQVLSKKTDLESLLERAKKERIVLEDTIEVSLKEKIDAENSVSGARSRIIELEGIVAVMDSELSDEIQRAKTQEKILEDKKIYCASLTEKVSGIQRELEATQKYIEDRKKRLLELVAYVERLVEEGKNSTNIDAETNQKIEELTLQLSTQREELSWVKDGIEQVNNQITQNLDRAKELSSSLDKKNLIITQHTLEVEKLNSELSYLIQNLEEKYGKDCLTQHETQHDAQSEMSDPIITSEITEEEEKILFEEVERLKEKIRRLGEVNTLAVEEFTELSGRHEVLITERADLLASIENLEDAIEHINKTSEARFNQAFHAIKDRFEKLFPIIFGGGSAELTLVYPEGSEDILEAGVDIHAQPPGKKVVNIGLLSGGEKALTAISLIFAIFMVKPSPFCILDEVDAPLDDSNIGKFNALLKEMASKTQFIVITHNKKTMELNDTLYGVTMEEPGVSKIVSVELQ